MADLVKRMKRSAKTIETGQTLVLDPALGSLTTPPAREYNGNIALEIGEHHISLTRAEFLAHAKRVAAVVALIED